jgi:cysteine desulfurase
VKVRKDGTYNMKSLYNILESIPHRDYILMCFQWANNEIGTIQDIGALNRTADKFGAYLHIDAVQALGLIKLDVTKYRFIDTMSLSGHKIGTPKGIGCLYKKAGTKLRPLIFGTQEFGLRGGTENVPYIMGFKKAIELSDATMEDRVTRIYPRYQKSLIKTFDIMGCTINGDRNNRLPNNINVTFHKNITGEALIYLLDTAGIRISAGSACNSHSQEISPVLKAIGISEDDAMRTIRVTIPEDITADDVFRFENELERAIDILTTNE